MTRPLLCLALFAIWAVVLVCAIALTRAFEVLTGKKRATDYPSGQPHGGDRYWRLNRAHLNTLENLPVFGALVIVATLAHVTGPGFAIACEIVVAARILQSLVHVASGSAMAINLRFAGFFAQLSGFGWLFVAVVRSRS